MTTIHDNRTRYPLNTWCNRYTITVGGSVVWTGNDLTEIPPQAMSEIANKTEGMSLYSMIKLFA